MKTFWELQQSCGYHWTHIGYFETFSKAGEAEKEFNTQIQVKPTRIVEREFSDDHYE